MEICLYTLYVTLNIALPAVTRSIARIFVSNRMADSKDKNLKVFAQINVFKKSIAAFSCNFLYSKYDIRYSSFKRASFF